MIESRYTIEYIDPTQKKETRGRKNIALFTFLSLLIITALIYNLFSSYKSNQLIRAPQNIQEQALDTKVTKMEVASESSTQVVANKELNDSINSLTKQLMAEKEKYKELNSQKNVRNKLPELVETISSTTDKTNNNYLSALNKLEKKLEIDIDNTKQIDSNIKATMTLKASPNKADSYNSISLSTNSKIDAIIAAMQAEPPPKKASSIVIKKNVDKSNEIQLAAVSATDPTELLHMQLQRKINQIIDKGNSKATTNKTYNIALESESNIRKNAVRSITIQKGETLWSIAQRAYGNGSLYTKIIEANPQINLDKLYLGQIIRVPN